jgi:hypothetical protein
MRNPGSIRPCRDFLGFSFFALKIRLCPFPVEYHPYNLPHLSEMLQILSFTGLVFFLMVKKLAPEPRSTSIM